MANKTKRGGKVAPKAKRAGSEPVVATAPLALEWRRTTDHSEAIRWAQTSGWQLEAVCDGWGWFFTARPLGPYSHSSRDSQGGRFTTPELAQAAAEAWLKAQPDPVAELRAQLAAVTAERCQPEATVVRLSETIARVASQRDAAVVALTALLSAIERADADHPEGGEPGELEAAVEQARKALEVKP